ncbi:unnamed protein product [Bathycoccus prasinos]
MLHESLRNFALARSPETARFSGRLEHPTYIFSLGREKNIFVISDSSVNCLLRMLFEMLYWNFTRSKS